MSSYGQFCPVAKAMEVLDERWTMLVVRELILGSRRFNELRRGNPRMSPALLSKRLRTLEQVGVVRREMVGGHASYTLTQAGQELEPVVRALGAWGTRWIGELGEEDANYIRGIVKKQRQFEVAGRALMYLPPAWPLAVASLSISKILDNM